MDASQIVVVGSVAVLGSALQGAVGFGSGLFSIPIMVWAGIPLPQAVMIAMVFVGGQNTWGAWRYRRDIGWRAIFLISGTCIALIPVGVALLGVMVGLGEAVVKLWVGCGLLAVLAMIAWLRVAPRPRVAVGWTLLAGSCSGLLTGLIGMGGPPLVLWVMAHDWPVNRSRASLWAIFMFCLPAIVLAMTWRFGETLLVAAGVGVLAMPLTAIGTAAGDRLSRLLSAPRLRKGSFAILTLIALNLIWQSV